MTPGQHPLERWLDRLYPYQRAMVFDPARFAVYVKARQIGFSHSVAAATVFSGLKERRTQIIISAAQDLSDEVLSKARSHCEILARMGDRSAVQYKVDNSTEIAWRSGGRIIALPANARTARSFSGDVYIDEGAYFLDPEGIRDATLPMVVRGNYRFRLISTPNGAQGMFYDYVTNPPEGWAVREIDIDTAARDGFEVDRETLFNTVAGGDERLFGQWFKCQFLDADLQFYPTAMVEAAQAWKGSLPDLGSMRIFAGLDVGREQDLTALTLLGLVDGVVWHLCTMTCKRTSYKEQRAIVRQARKTFEWEHLCIDSTGIGNEMSEELVEEFGEGETTQYYFTNDSKADLATRGLRWFRNGRVRLERGEEGTALARECIAMRRQITTSGNVVYEVPRSRAGHGDRAWSYLLALWGAGEPPAARGIGKAPMFAVP